MSNSVQRNISTYFSNQHGQQIIVPEFSHQNSIGVKDVDIKYAETKFYTPVEWNVYRWRIDSHRFSIWHCRSLGLLSHCYYNCTICVISRFHWIMKWDLSIYIYLLLIYMYKHWVELKFRQRLVEGWIIRKSSIANRLRTKSSKLQYKKLIHISSDSIAPA